MWGNKNIKFFYLYNWAGDATSLRFDLLIQSQVELLENFPSCQRRRVSYEVYLSHGKQEIYP